MAVNKGYLTAKTDKASDECYTPRDAVLPIIKYIDHGNKLQYTIWCPFDTAESEYVKCIQEAGHKVIFSHIDNGQIFLNMSQMSIMIILFPTLLLVLRMIF